MGEFLGEFEQLVLFALLRLEDRAYGVSIRQEIQARAGRDVSAGAVYTTLQRLEARGYVSSALGEATAERGGKRKRFYRIEPRGSRALGRSWDAMRRMARGVAARLETP